MEQRADVTDLRRWFATRATYGIGLVCGAISGNLEMAELEGRAMTGSHLDKVEAAVGKAGIGWLWYQLTNDGYAESTPSGGMHLLYRIGDHAVPGNTPIARRPATAEELQQNPRSKFKVLAETRGERGYVVVAPSGGAVHETGDAWTVLAGKIGDIPTITWEQRNLLHQALHDALDEMPEEVPYIRAARSVVSAGLKPGEDFCQRTDLVQMMVDYGWSVSHRRGQETFLTRPGKDRRGGHSATVGYAADKQRLYVFSSSTEFPTEQPFDAFAVYAMMEHGGDFRAAARDLRAKGYGETGTPVPETVKAEPAETVPAVGSEPQRPEGWLTEWTEAGAGDYLNSYLHNRFRQVAEEKIWRHYDAGVWRVDKTKELPRAVNDLTAPVYRRAQDALAEAEEAGDKALIGRARKNASFATRCRSHDGTKAITAKFSEKLGVTVGVDAFDSDKNLVCMSNGTLDLGSMVFREHRWQDMLTRKTGVVYDKSATAPLWQKFLETALPDPNVRAYVQRLAGYTLSGDASEDVVVFIQGLSGCGKSTFLGVLAAVFEDFAATAAAATFRAKRGDGDGPTNNLSDLRGKRLVHTSETSQNTVFDEELLKRVAGGDSVRSRALFESNIEWSPEFVAWIATNYAPKLSEDPAIWRRVRMVEFPVQFGVDGGPVADKTIGDRIVGAELSGVFNWIIDGLVAYRRNGLGEPDTVVEAVRQHRASLNPVQQFLVEAEADERIVVEAGAEIRATQLFDIYSQWCVEHSQKRVYINRFGQMLSELGYGDRKSSGGVRIRLGVRAGVRGERGTMSPPPAW